MFREAFFCDRMTKRMTSTQQPPIDFSGVAEWIIARGLQGLPIDEQLAGFSQRIYEAGFPMKRMSMGMRTLHPRYGGYSYVWRADEDRVEHSPHERTVQELDSYQRSPIFFMIETGADQHRQRLDTGEPLAFPILEELRDAGMTDYAARIVLYNPAAQGDSALEGVFFSCATDEPPGFHAGHLQQVIELLPYLAMAIKSRLTYDVANTVTATYLGKDAGRRVLTGEIERGSTQTIQAVIWFCDLRGFTQLADTLPRDELIELLDDYLDAMAHPVHENQGQILKFIGDGFLATFDLTAVNSQAVCRHALKAAAELRIAFGEFNRARQAANKRVLDFGLALHLGEVFYGNIGANDRLDFTVVGPAVNEASRIQDLCRPLRRDVLISRTFRDVVGTGLGELTSLGAHKLPGVSAAQELFALSTD